jgi:hypothetical protein
MRSIWTVVTVPGSSEADLDSRICPAHHWEWPPPGKTLSLWFVNHLVTVDKVNANDGFLMKPLDDLARMVHGVVPDLDFHVIGPHYIEVLSISPLTWVIGPRSMHWLSIRQQ